MFGFIQGIANAFGAKKANKELGQLLTQDPTFTKSPFAAQQLATAQNAYLDPSMGTQPQLNRNLLSGFANFGAGVDRSATDSSQALALKAAGLGKTEDTMANANLDFMGNKMNLLGNLNQAYGANIEQDFAAEQDKIRKFGVKSQIKGQQRQNKTNAVNGIFNGLNSDFNDFICP